MWAPFSTMVVLKKEQQDDRTLLYGSNPHYYVITGPKVEVEIGDTIEYEIYGVNFGWFSRVISRNSSSSSE